MDREALLENAAAVLKMRTHDEGLPDPRAGLTALGKAWAGVLSLSLGIDVPPLRADVCALMLVAMKVNRAALRQHSDDYVDAVNYLAFAAQLRPPPRDDAEARRIVGNAQR